MNALLLLLLLPPPAEVPVAGSMRQGKSDVHMAQVLMNGTAKKHQSQMEDGTSRGHMKAASARQVAAATKEAEAVPSVLRNAREVVGSLVGAASCGNGGGGGAEQITYATPTSSVVGRLCTGTGRRRLPRKTISALLDRLPPDQPLPARLLGRGFTDARDWNGAGACALVAGSTR